MIEPKTVSIQVAMQLESEEYPQNKTYWYWVFKLDWGEWRLISGEDLTTLDLSNARVVAAPTGDDLDEDMPIGFKASKVRGNWATGWYYNYGFLDSFKQKWEAKTIRDVKGKAWCWLNKSHLLKYPKQSEPFAFVAQMEEAEKNGIYDFLKTRAVKVENI